MGKKKKKVHRSQREEVIVIDVDENSSHDETVADYHARSSGNSHKTKKQSRDSTTNSTQIFTDSGDSDCIDLTEPDPAHRDNENNSEDVLLIDDNISEIENRRRQLSVFEIMRQCRNNPTEQFKGSPWKDDNTMKSSRKKRKKKDRMGDSRKELAQDQRQKKDSSSPSAKENAKLQERKKEDNRTVNKCREKDEKLQDSSDHRRYSPRKHTKDQRSPKRRQKVDLNRDRQDDDVQRRRSPRKRRRSQSRDRRSRSGDRHNDRSRSPVGAKQKRQERNESFAERNLQNSRRSNQNRLEKTTYNYNDNSGRDEPKRNTNLQKSDGYNRGNRKAEGNNLVQYDDSVDGIVDDSKSICAVAVPVKDGALVILPHPAEYILKGKAVVQTLVGSVSVLGHLLEDPTKTYDIYSPECNSLIKLETIAGEKNKNHVKESVSSQFSEAEDDVDFQKKVENLKSVIVLKVSRLNSNVCDYLTTLTPYQNLFSMGGNKGDPVNKVLSPVGVSLFQRTWQPHVMMTNELNEAIDDWNSSLTQTSKVPPCMMVVGGKDSGKSTTNRVLINSSLNSIDGVYFLECDAGQTEFTPPGCISLLYVTQPVFGPPFSHQRKPLCSYFFGGLSPTDDPGIYLECVQRCVQHYQKLGEPGPLIVNTMGWVKGLGLKLLVDILRLVCPSHVIQLMCRQKHHNCDPVDEYFHLQESWQDVTKENMWRDADMASDTVQSTRREHKLTIIDSISKSVDLNGMAVRLKAIDFRNLSLLSHLHSNLDSHMTLTSAAPFTVPWKDVAVHICYMRVPREQIMYSLNAGVVALCHTDLEKQQTERPTEDSPMFFKSMPICEWIGFGIVRGIDPVKKELYIVTSVDLSALKLVNTLLKGSVSLPEQVLMKQHCHGNRLYVDDAVQSLGLAAVKPRRHMPRSRLENSAPSPGPSTS